MAAFYKFPMIPFDISLYIHKLKIDNATNLIINNWYNYIHKKVIAITLINNITSSRDPIYNYNPYINHSDNKLLKVLKFCDKILSGNEDKIWWKNKISLIVSLFAIQINNNNACINDPIFMDILVTCKNIYIKFDTNITNNINNYITNIISLNNNNYNNYINNFNNNYINNYINNSNN